MTENSKSDEMPTAAMSLKLPIENKNLTVRRSLKPAP
jgi:hypothetical protein